MYLDRRVVGASAGELAIDDRGSPIGAVRLDPAQAYPGVPELLKAYLDEGSEEAWRQIGLKIDHIYDALGEVLGALGRETGFGAEARRQIAGGKRLLFKPNIVGPMCIDPLTHGEGRGNIACTPWPFVAALMRWFHDNLDVAYNLMALGEGGTGMSGTADGLSKLFGKGRQITAEALLEGRAGEFAGGWGFYFVRKYLSDRHPAGHTDDPLSGYAESVSGEYVPPGKAGNRLLVYDLNRVGDPPTRGRAVPVDNGSCFTEITLHKSVVGGDPENPEDRADYPGCVLVNVPRLKVHNRALLTNAIKNLGVGLYPMEATAGGTGARPIWKYSFPPGPLPRLKYGIPHSVWYPVLDAETGLPVEDDNGEYVVTKTGGLSGAMIDLMCALRREEVFTIHVADAIECLNVSHDTAAFAQKVPEGFVFASLDPVALDLLGARYLFKTVPLAEARRLREKGVVAGEFVQSVPQPRVAGAEIIAERGFDAPLARYSLFAWAERRGLGQQRYRVVGRDLATGQPLASAGGHLGALEGPHFVERLTSTFYYDHFKVLWDMQTTILAYLRANDALTGSHYYDEILRAFDEDGDGVIDYDESGKRRFQEVVTGTLAAMRSEGPADEHTLLRKAFQALAEPLRCAEKNWNARGRDTTRAFRIAQACAVAYDMSKMTGEARDPFFPSLTWGRGKWPTLQYVLYLATARAIYGAAFPDQLDHGSLYGLASQYAARTQRGAVSAVGQGRVPDGEASLRVAPETLDGLDFTLYVPPGYGSPGGRSLAHVEETNDPAKVLTAIFAEGTETW